MLTDTPATNPSCGYMVVKNDDKHVTSHARDLLGPNEFLNEEGCSSVLCQNAF